MTGFCINSIWKIEPTGFAEGLDGVIRERKDCKDDSKIFNLQPEQLEESDCL